MTRSTHSRRTFLGAATALWTNARLARAQVQQGRQLELAVEFPKATGKAVSADGTQLCLERWDQRGYPLRVIDTASGQIQYEKNFGSRAVYVQFFGDRKALLLQFPPARAAHSNKLVLVDLLSRKETVAMHPYDLQGYQIQPTRNGTLLVERRLNNHLQWYALKTFPDLKERLRKSYPLHLSGLEYWETVLCPDASVGVSFCDNTIEFLSLEDLKTLWQYPVDKGLRAFKLAVSAKRGRVAAAIADDTGTFDHHEYFILILDALKGTKVISLPFNGVDGLALSADGRHVAVVAKHYGEQGHLITSVHLYEVDSGTLVSSLVHSQVPRERNQFMESGAALCFTADGRYLITSGMDSKVWIL